MKIITGLILALTMPSMGSAANRDIATSDKFVDGRVEVDFSKHQGLARPADTEIIDETDVAFVIPTDMDATGDSARVEKDIVKHWGRSLSRTSYVRDNHLVRTLKRTASSIQKATVMELKTATPKVKAKVKPKSPVDLVPVPEEINHAFNFKVQALKQEAKLIYRGFFESTLTYKQKTNEVVFHANKAITENAQVGVSSQSVRQGSNHFVNYGYTW